MDPQDRVVEAEEIWLWHCQFSCAFTITQYLQGSLTIHIYTHSCFCRFVMSLETFVKQFDIIILLSFQKNSYICSQYLSFHCDEMAFYETFFLQNMSVLQRKILFKNIKRVSAGLCIIITTVQAIVPSSEGRVNLACQAWPGLHCP